MKKITSLFIVMLSMVNYVAAQSENYQVFRMEITPHVTYIPAKFGGWGGGLSIEPKINITDNICAGIRIVETIFGSRNGISAGNSAASVDLGITFMTSYGIVGEYFFTTNKFRPYVGLSLRRYSYVSVSESVNAGNSNASASISARSAAKWGFEPEVGVSFPGIRFSVGYNLLFGGSDIYVNETANNSGGTVIVSSQRLDYSHISYKVGFTIAGRKK